MKKTGMAADIKEKAYARAMLVPATTVPVTIVLVMICAE